MISVDRIIFELLIIACVVAVRIFRIHDTRFRWVCTFFLYIGMLVNRTHTRMLLLSTLLTTTFVASRVSVHCIIFNFHAFEIFKGDLCTELNSIDTIKFRADTAIHEVLAHLLQRGNCALVGSLFALFLAFTLSILFVTSNSLGRCVIGRFVSRVVRLLSSIIIDPGRIGVIIFLRSRVCSGSSACITLCHSSFDNISNLLLRHRLRILWQWLEHLF